MSAHLACFSVSVDIGMKNAILDSIKLKSSSNHLLNELAQCVEQNNRPKGLGGIISRLAWLGYNHRDQLLEVSGPVLE